MSTGAHLCLLYTKHVTRELYTYVSMVLANPVYIHRYNVYGRILGDSLAKHTV